MIDWILGGLLIIYTLVALRYGDPWVALLISVCAVVVLGNKLWRLL